MFDVVLGVFFDVLGAGGRVVVEDFVGAEAFEVGEVAGGGSGDDLEAGEFGVLDGEGASGGRAAVDEDGEFGGGGGGGEGQLEGLVESLADAGKECVRWMGEWVAGWVDWRFEGS